MKSWLLALALAALAAGGIVFWKMAAGRPTAADAEQWHKTESDLRARLAQAEKRLSELGHPLPAAEAREESGSARPPGTVTPYSRREADLAELIRLKDEQLTKSETALADLRTKYAEIEQRIAAVQEQDKQLRDTETTLRQRIDANTEQIVELQQANKQKDTRLGEQDASLKVLRTASEQQARSLQRVRALSEDLEDLARRREVYMANILGRYRDATDSLRTLGLQLENRTDDAPIGRTDISRIQSALSSADEDMRQLRSLATRSRQLQKELLAVK
ncbi:MAG: hypothetical protein IT163_08645 [Bryobacterales bacterium]|nr:hypothetical protein [Bryobacterales bacterium]